MGALRMASQEGKHWWEGSRGVGIRTAHELHASVQMTWGISNPWPLLVWLSSRFSVSPTGDKSNGIAALEVPHRHGWVKLTIRLFLLWHRFVCCFCLPRGICCRQLPFFTYTLAKCGRGSSERSRDSFWVGAGILFYRDLFLICLVDVVWGYYPLLRNGRELRSHERLHRQQHICVPMKYSAVRQLSGGERATTPPHLLHRR